MSDPLVSIYCATYNHVGYIRNALDSFLSQDADFGFEVIVHDDASTDGTSDIVAEYAREYPNIIKPIIQTTNQYSLGANIFFDFVLPRVRGAYVARCEGDDYWCNSNKLTRQVRYLETHPNCSASTHNTLLVDYLKGKKRLLGSRKSIDAIPFWKITSENAGFHTSSILHRTEAVKRELPHFMKVTPGIGDYPLRILLGLYGDIQYYGDAMSVYRKNIPGSFSIVDSSIEKRIYHINNLVKMLEEADEWSSYEHHSDFAESLLEMQCAAFDAKGEQRKILKEPYRSVAIRRYSYKSFLRIVAASIMNN